MIFGMVRKLDNLDSSEQKPLKMLTITDSALP
jgi:hypothetical protein